MDPALVTVIVAIVGIASTIVSAWLRHNLRCERHREAARRDHIRHLPAGSRVVDLGKRGMLIEIGSTARREAHLDDER